MTGRNEDRVYITYLDIIYSKDNNVRIQACWVAKGKTFSFLIGKVLTGACTIRHLYTAEAVAKALPFLIGKVLT